jgi:oxygen-dependent protoporphyrinogen oxidase
MGIQASPRFSTIYFWPRSMPQYVVGHEARLQRIAGMLNDTPGVYLAGNCYSGVGVPDCVRIAKETAKAISEHNRAGSQPGNSE